MIKMKALLLNSGIGSRMGNLTADRPKCMSEIGHGYTIISWQLELLQRLGVRKIIITTGPFSDLLIDYVIGIANGLDAEFVINPAYKDTNYIYSMYLAKQHLDDDILLLHGDLVLEQSVAEDLLRARYSAVAVDSSLDLPLKDFKAKICNGRIKAIGTDLFGDDCVACQPAYKFSKNDFKIWLREIERFCQKGETRVYAENALNCITDKINLFPLELNGRLCAEIDNAVDLKTVSQRFSEIL